MWNIEDLGFRPVEYVQKISRQIEEKVSKLAKSLQILVHRHSEYTRGEEILDIADAYCGFLNYYQHEIFCKA